MAKNKGTRILITLECTDCRLNLNKRLAGITRYQYSEYLSLTEYSRSSPGVSRYHTEKNRRNNPERLELKKYCPHCNKPTIHKEIK